MSKQGKHTALEEHLRRLGELTWGILAVADLRDYQVPCLIWCSNESSILPDLNPPNPIPFCPLLRASLGFYDPASTLPSLWKGYH